MKVRELTEKLSKVSPDASVVIEMVDPGSGCDTYGYGQTYSEFDVTHVEDLETRVVLRM